MVNEITKLNPERPYGIKVYFALFLSALIAAFLWVYYLSQGFSQPGILDGYYDIQAYALQNGHLAITPDYHHIFYHDASFYKGNYYFYWGLLPSALHAFLSILTGWTVSSYLTAFIFLFLFVYFFQRIIFEIMHTAAARTSSPQNVFITCAAVILSWILIFNLPFSHNSYNAYWIFGRFTIYEQAIIFGLGLAMPGLFCLIKGQKGNNPLFLTAAACLFAAAAWVRGTWFVFSFLAVPVIFGELLIKKNLRSLLKWPHYLFMTVPVLLMGGLLALNFARFGNIFDFGLKLQNPVLFKFLRIENGLFSPVTHFFNTAYKILAYYTSPELMRLSGVWEKSSSQSEGMAPFLFYNNPLLLLLAPLVLYGVYRAFRGNRNMRNIIIAVGSAALIINGVIVSAGVIVAMRFFVECYYLTILLVFAGMTALLPPKVSVPILALLLGIHLPGNIKAFMETRPELRLIKIVESKTNQADYISVSPDGTFFIYRDAHWHEGIVTALQKENFTEYNTIGIIPLKDGLIGATDICAVYIKPQNGKVLAKNRALLEFVSVQSVSKPGRIRVYLEKTKIAQFNIVPDEARTYRTAINYNFRDDAPCRLLIYFFEDNASGLPAKIGSHLVFVCKAIILSPAIANHNTAIR